MCGIFCSVLYNQTPFLHQLAKGNFKNSNFQFSECFEALQQRGPDCYNELNLDVSTYTVLQCAASVLWMQGLQPVQQPCTDAQGNVLLWNGDIFKGSLAGDDSEDNDTVILSERLLKASILGDEIPEVFSKIRGPYSFIYYHRNSKKLYFGRDVLGRHSLLIGYSQRNITVTSVASRKLEDFREIPAVGIFEFNLEKDGDITTVLYPWSHVPEEVLTESKLLPDQLMNKFHMGEVLKSYLLMPVRRNTTPTREELEMWSTTDPNLSVSQLMDKLSSGDSKSRIHSVMSILSEKPSLQVLIEDLLNTLRDAVKVRLEKCPSLCQKCTADFVKDKKLNTCRHAKLAILFSGGLDSSVLAVLANSFVPEDEPIDLLNVAFEKSGDKPDFKLIKRSGNENRKSDANVGYNVPDRITGLDTWKELKELFPKRTWNFVQIDVSLEELKRERERVIASLIYPLNTVLDDSLGCALWFASRGRGVIPNRNEEYTTPARIVLSGIGADEQLGGYMRHRTTLRHKGGWEALEKEFQMELRRISKRNLGRDDRMVSSHGRQCRMPFLDEDVINFLSFIPPWYKCYPVESMPPGVGDKLLLRLCAWTLGLRNACNLPKRAFQFGSRIANSKERGSDVSERL